MNNVKISQASAELIEILKYLPKNFVERIPLDVREFLFEVSNKSYVTKIDPNKPLEEQEIKEETKDLIAIIYRSYWCNEEERQKLDEKLKDNDKKYEDDIRKKYCPDSLFNNKKVKNETQNTKQTSMVEVKQKNFVQKILERIKIYVIGKSK